MVCPECGHEYTPGEATDPAGPSIAAAIVFTIALAALAGLLACTWLLGDAWCTRDMMRWWFAGAAAGVVAAYALTACLFPAAFRRWRPRRSGGLLVYLLLASGLYAMVAFAMVWLRGLAAQS